jgi:hypothetical protein
MDIISKTNNTYKMFAASVWFFIAFYELDDRVSSIPGGGWEFFSSPPRPERL